jgi:hypothetical protein
MFTTLKSFHTSYGGLTNRMATCVKTRGTNMASTETTKTEAPKTQDTTKDTGRVKIGSGCIDFSGPRVATKDTGRVRIGSGCIQF